MSESAPPPPTTEPVSYATPASGYQGPPPTKDESNMALLIYILCIFTGFIGPLIIWLMKKDQSPFLDNQGKEALNWNITFIIGLIASAILMIILVGIITYIAFLLCHLIFNIMGAIKASKGMAYRYPFALRLLK
jgi:uncharacterized Tic20 family protein